jgi:4-amino-4-deoxy-L-arabinose transferase-like glycosyltransferase
MPAIAIVIFLSLICAILLQIFSNWVFPYTTDSVIHISTAENILRGNGLVFNNFFVVPPEPEVLPTHLAPPGYPILVALLGAIGINVYHAALAIPAFSYLALPFLFYFLFKNFMTEKLACVAMAFCVLSASFVYCSSIAWTDVPYLCFVLASLIIAFKVIDKEEKVTFTLPLLAGIFAGMSFLIRFSGAAVIGAILCVLLISKFRLKKVIIFILGCSIIAIPYLVRNVLVFGNTAVYPAPIAIQTYCSNAFFVFEYYLKGLSLVLFGTYGLPWLVMGVIISIFILAVIFLKNTKVWTVLLYFLFYSVFLIHFKSIAFIKANLDVDERLMIQVGWVLMTGLVMVVYEVLKGSRVKLTASLVLLVILLSLQINSFVSYKDKQSKVKALATDLQRYFPNDIPASQVILTNVPDMIYFYAKRPVRALAHYSPKELVEILGPHKHFSVILVRNAGSLSPAWFYFPNVWNKPEGYLTVFADEKIEVLTPYPADFVNK